jgi:cyclase
MIRSILFAAVIGTLSAPLLAQQPAGMPPPGMGAGMGMGMGMGPPDFDSLTVASPEHVAGNVYRVVGAVIVNMAFSVGEDGILLVDSNFEEMTEKILAAIREVSDDPIRFLIDTHAHGDHADGNVTFGKLGSVIVAHDSVRDRMANPPQDPTAPLVATAAPAIALPIVTFSESVTFHFNGEEVQAFYIARAHTDGDILIYFKGSNVIHMGDVFGGQYPLIDRARDGSFLGFIETVNAAIGIVEPDTKIMPGHGAIAGRNDLIEFRDMLQDIHGRISDLAQEGKTLEQVIAARPTADHDDKWAGPRGSDGLVTAAYNEIMGE